MMLSPQAARMGTVNTTLRKIGCSKSRLYTNNRILSAVLKIRVGKFNSCPANTIAIDHKAFLQHKLQRFKSTAALDELYEDETLLDGTTSTNLLKHSTQLGLHAKVGHEAAAAIKATATDRSLVDEPWRINLGRGNDNAWLMQPRNDQEWFTGLSPNCKDCPGPYCFYGFVDERIALSDSLSLLTVRLILLATVLQPSLPKGVDEHGSIRSLPLPNLSSLTRQYVKDYFDNSWTLYETLFAGLKGEEPFYRPPVHGLRHPQIFYYGHTACLYINKLRVAGVLKHPVNAYFESIFEVGVDEMLWDDMHKNDMMWPTVSEVRDYRKQVYKTVSDVIENHPSLDDTYGPVKVDKSHPMWALFMGFEHERIHLETSSVLFRETPLHLIQTPLNWPPLHPSAYKTTDSVRSTNPQEGIDYPSNRMIPVQQTLSVDLGKPADFPSYGWDNEYGERTVDVPPFLASEHMITNGEYWKFVKLGGYRKKEYWCDDGWAWRSYRNLKWPFFWVPAGPAGSNEFHLRTIFDLIPMAWDWPVDVNYYEAKAYCNWKTEEEGLQMSKTYRLLTEAEHHIIRHQKHNLQAARKDVQADKVMVTSGRKFAEGSTGANLNLAYSSQNPVDYFPPSETGHRDPTGNAWEWTEDHFNPLKGFEVHHVYDDFSTPCFDGKHSMIVGGSFMSTGDEASVFARFHFRPHFLQHSGFRLVSSEHQAPATHLFAGRFAGQAAAYAAEKVVQGVDDVDSNLSVYETDNSLHMYLGLHYPNSGLIENVSPILPHKNSPNHGLRFPQRVAALLATLKPSRTNDRALDIGCAVGGASFELAKTFAYVDAFDFSSSFITAARQMQIAPEDVKFRIPVEGDLFEEVQAIHENGITSEIRSKVNFFTGDACKLIEMAAVKKLSSYDGVIMSNLLCRLTDPMACINGLAGIVNTGGVVVMVTPFSWMTEFTPRSKWLGGFKDPVSKEPIYSRDVLQKEMEIRGFEKIHEEEFPLVIREHQRKYQYIVSLATGWRKIH